MQIDRNQYLNELLIRRKNGMIKVVTGMRRAGKSYLLTKIFRSRLLSEGVRPDHVLDVALDDRRRAKLRDPDAMLAWIEGNVKDGETHYLILDEVQFLKDFAEVLNSCLHIDNLDVYVTGSNSRFLSTDVATEFRGRGDEVHVFPLSFAEFSAAVKLPFDQALDDYLRYGGLPYTLACATDKQKMSYLTHLFREVYVKDLVERNGLQHPGEMEELLRFYASSIGSLSSLRKLSDTFMSVKGVRLSVNTIGSYSRHLEDAFLVRKAMRYDVRGRRYVDSPQKCYFEDLGIRNACLGFRQMERTHLMENLIYNELRQWGFAVDVGNVVTNGPAGKSRVSLEVDFVANQGHRRYYIQSAYQIPDDEKREQETRPLLKINDAFRKILVTFDGLLPYHNEDGILVMALKDFLKGPGALDL